MKAVQAPAEPTQPVDEHAALNETLNQWRQAWSAKNVTSYLSFYGPDFVPPKGLNRTTWEAARNERISSKEKIVIDIQNLRLQINNNTATAKFTQAYRDERLRMTDSKTLVWQKLNGRWLILRETTE
jgi:ketosteroid isomerase-like protein